MSVHSVSDAETLPLTQTPSPQKKVPSLGEGGSRFVDSGPNSVTSFNSMSLGGNTAQTNYYPRFRKSKVSFMLPEEAKKGSKSGEKGESSKDKKKEKLVQGNEEEEEGDGKKTFNLRPRKEKEKKVGNSRSHNHQNNANDNGSIRVTRQMSKLAEIPTPTGLRTQTRSRTAMNNANACKNVFSLTLTKSEIESDFLKMTGELPPKKPLKRPKNVQNHLDAIFPGMFLDTITPETYKLPDPPLKG